MPANSKESSWFNQDFDSIDTVDVLAFISLLAGGAVISGLAVIEVAGYDLSSVVYTLGSSTEISAAMVLPVLGLVAGVWTNEFDRDDYMEMSTGEKVAIGTVIVGLFSVMFAPDIAAIVETNTITQVIYTSLHGVSGLVIASE